jgi:hypothetical protein
MDMQAKPWLLALGLSLVAPAAHAQIIQAALCMTQAN